MSITAMSFVPATGLSDATFSPQTPVSEVAIRGQFQSVSNQLRDYINNTLIPQLLASNIPNTAIAGMTSLFVQDALAELKTQINSAVTGAIPDGSLVDSKFNINNLSTPQYKLTTNSGNAYSVAVTGLTALIDGYPLCVRFNAASTGAITINPNNLGNYTVVDYFGNAVTNVMKDLIANLRYNPVAGNFQLQGKGGGGNLVAGDLRLNKTATGDSGPVVGSLADNGATGATLTNQAQSYVIPSGITTGGTVTTNITNLTAGVITSPNVVGGITGIAGALVVGDNPFISIMAGNTTFATSYTKIREIKVNASGAVRVKYSLQPSTLGYSVYAKLYVNGVARGIERTTSNAPFASSEDITVNTGDLIQIYAYTSDAVHSGSLVSGFNLCIANPVDTATVNM